MGQALTVTFLKDLSLSSSFGTDFNGAGSQV